MVSDLKSGSIDAAWGVPQAQFSASAAIPTSRACRTPTTTGTTSSSTPTTSRARWVTRCCATGGSATPWNSTRSTSGSSRRSPTRAMRNPARPSSHPWASSTTPRLPLAAAGRPDLHLQPRQGRPDAHPGRLRQAPGGRRTPPPAGQADQVAALRVDRQLDQEQTEAKLIAGWLGQLGLKITLSIVDPGTLTSDIYNARGKTWAPDYDLVVWNSRATSIPARHSVCFTTPQIGSLDEPCFSNAQVRHAERSSSRRPSTRRRARRRSGRCSGRHLVSRRPGSCVTYPDLPRGLQHLAGGPLAAAMFGGRGPAFNTEGLHRLVSGLEARKTATAAAGSSSTVS